MNSTLCGQVVTKGHLRKKYLLTTGKKKLVTPLATPFPSALSVVGDTVGQRQ